MKYIILVCLFFFWQSAFSAEIDEQIISYFRSDFNNDFLTDPYEAAFNNDSVENLIRLIRKIKNRHYYNSVEFQADKEYGFYSVSINAKVKKRVKKLPLYPVRRNNYATLSSFRDTEDDDFFTLPNLIKDEFLQRRRKMEAMLDQANSGAVSWESFEKSNNQILDISRFQEIFHDSNFVLYGEDWKQDTNIKGIQFIAFVEAGPYQINYKYQESRKGIPLFMFDHSKDSDRIKIHRVQPSNRFAFVPNSSVVIEISKNVFYIGSIHNNFRGYDIVWDARKKQIRYLTFFYGASYGNVLMTMDESYLLEHRNKKHLLRFNRDRQYCEVNYFNNNQVTTHIHSDITAPEI